MRARLKRESDLTSKGRTFSVGTHVKLHHDNRIDGYYFVSHDDLSIHKKLFAHADFQRHFKTILNH